MTSETSFNPNYRDDALCFHIGIDTQEFFPERITKSNYSHIQSIVSNCFQCPVQIHCLYESIVNEHYGIWGGCLEKQRFAWIKEMNKTHTQITFADCVDFINTQSSARTFQLHEE